MAPMTDLDAVVLDVGGVLLLPSPARVRQALDSALAEPVAVTPEAVRRAHYRGVAVPASDAHEHRGDHWPVRLDRYVACFADELDVPEPARPAVTAALHDLFTGPSYGLWSEAEPAAVDALRALHELGVPLAVVSNADGTIARQLADAGVCQVGAGPGVPVVAVVDSGDVGISKPDPRLFAHALDALGVPAGRALYVGDTPAVDLVGARAAGMPTVIVDPYGWTDLADDETVPDLGAVVAAFADRGRA